MGETEIAKLEIDCQRLVGERGKQASARLRAAEEEAIQLRGALEGLQEQKGGEDQEASAKCMSTLQEVKACLEELDEGALQAKARLILQGLGLRKSQVEAATSS